MTRSRGEYKYGPGTEEEPNIQRLEDARGTNLPTHAPMQAGFHGRRDQISPTKVYPVTKKDILGRRREVVVGECGCGKIFEWNQRTNYWKSAKYSNQS